MREAIGGSILFYIILGFIGVFIVFISIIMNYASAYSINNQVLTVVEKDYDTLSFRGNNKVKGLIDELKEIGYNNGLNISCAENKNGYVFRVTTYTKFIIPLLDVEIPVPISNDTKTLKKITGVNDCKNLPVNGTWS